LLVPEPGDRAHDAVRLEDSDAAVRGERRRHGAEGMNLEEGVGLEQPTALETYATDPFSTRCDLRRHRRNWPRVEIPEPILQLAR
jgi:hypothetical protein